MQLSRRQIIAYAAVAVVVVAMGVRYVVLPKSAGPSEAQAVVLAPVASSSSAIRRLYPLTSALKIAVSLRLARSSFTGLPPQQKKPPQGSLTPKRLSSSSPCANSDPCRAPEGEVML